MSHKKRVLIVILAFALSVSFQGNANATLPTFDAVNAFLSEVRNALLQNHFVKDIALSLERLEQLKATYQEMLRFHAGLDDLIDVVVGDPLRELRRLGRIRVKDIYPDLDWFTPRIEFLDEAREAGDIRTALEEITGPMPESDARPYIPFEEMQVVEGFQFAKEIREAGRDTREEAEKIGLEAKIASPKGAARLQAQAAAQSMLLSQQNQEALAKLIELQATQVEQVSREEKRFERERVRYMEDMNDALQRLWEAA